MRGDDPSSRRRRSVRRTGSHRPTTRLAALGGRQPATLDVAVVDALGRPIRVPGLGRWLADLLPLTVPAAVNIALVSDNRVKDLNTAYRGKRRVTDVLSFPAYDPNALNKLLTKSTLRRWTARFLLGDIVIASGQARRQARQMGHSLGTELRVLALHGLLHLIGYDHDVDGGTMAALERTLRRKGRLPEGLIERAGGRLDGKPR